MTIYFDPLRKFEYILPSGDRFSFTLDVRGFSNPETLHVVECIGHADLLYDSLKKLVTEMAPINLIAQSQDYRDAETLLALIG